jgi:hypothetical protein
MSSPITKIWLFALKPGVTVTSPVFLDLWTEIIAHCASYTSPTAADDTKYHTLYQSEDDPSQLAMITGYQSLAMNLEADMQYAAQYMKPIQELVTHQQLFLLHVDVKDLPLSSGAVTVFKAEKEFEPGMAGKGARDCYEASKKSEGIIDDEREKAWVQVVASTDADQVQGVQGLIATWRLERIMGQ